MREVSRRGILASVGTMAAASLAGCNALGNSEPTIAGDELAATVSGEAPTIPNKLPIQITEDRLDEREATLRDTLDAVPTPLTSSEVPNGAIREQLIHRYQEATDSLTAAADASTPWEWMGILHRTWSEAGYVGGAWSAIDANRKLSDVRTDGEALRKELDSFRRQWTYVGTAPIDALVVHDAIADLARGCIGDLNRVLTAEADEYTTVLNVAERHADLATARSALRDSTYLFGQLTSPTASRDLGTVFEAASESLVDEYRARHESLVAGGTLTEHDINDTNPARYALNDLQYGIRPPNEIETIHPAREYPRSITSVHRLLATITAYETLRDRIDADEALIPRSADDVRTLRRRARDALTSAMGGEYRTLDRLRLHRLSDYFEYLDAELERYSDREEVSLNGLNRELSGYVRIETVAAATHSSSETVAHTLQTATQQIDSRGTI